MDILGWAVSAIFGGMFFVLKWTWKAIAWALKSLWRLVRPNPNTFGRAAWAHPLILWRKGYFGKSGLIIGKVKTPFGRRLIRYAPEGHATVVAPPRQGKGANFIIPNLLEHPGSAIVTDPKAENYDITSRRRASFGPVYAINLIDPHLSDQFNPFDIVRLGTDYVVDDVEMIADGLIKPEPHESQHWNDKARMTLTGFILYLLHKKPEPLRTLPELARLVNQDDANLQHTLMEMAEMEFESCQATAHDLISILKTNEGPSVLSTVKKALKLWSNDRLASRLVAASSFSLETFKREVATLYIIIPPDKMLIYAPLLRLFSALSLAAMTRDMTRPRHPVLILLDEARLLGRLDLLPETIAVSSGYGVRVVPIWQDLGQVRELYGDDSVVKMCALQLYFGVTDSRAAKDLSDRIGQYTVRMRSFGQTGHMEDVVHRGRSHGQSEAGRPLIYPAEIMQSSDIFAFTPKFPAIRCTPAPYFKQRRWKGLYDAWRGRVTPINLAPKKDQSEAA